MVLTTRKQIIFHFLVRSFFQTGGRVRHIFSFAKLDGCYWLESFKKWEEKIMILERLKSNISTGFCLLYIWVLQILKTLSTKILLFFKGLGSFAQCMCNTSSPSASLPNRALGLGLGLAYHDPKHYWLKGGVGWDGWVRNMIWGLVGSG